MTTASTINVPLLQRVLDYVTAHPEEHDQGSWGYQGPECGTRFCLAGHAVSMSNDYQLAWVDETDEFAETEGRERFLVGVVPTTTASEELVLDEEHEFDELPGALSVADGAARALGLEEYHGLFGATNTLHELWYHANDMCDGQLVVPERFQGEPND